MSYYYSNGPITTKIITDETFRVHQGFDMALLDDMTMPPSNLLTFEVAGREPFLDFKSTLARKLGYPLNHFRVWVLSASRLSQGYREEVKIIRVSRVVPEDDPELTMDKIRKMGSNTPGLILYVEVLDPEREALPAGPKENQRMVFVKYFDAINQKLDGVGHFYVNRRGSDLKEFVRTRNNLHPNARIDFYKEIGPGETNIRKDFTSGYSEEVRNGDIFCFQVELPDQAIAELRRQKLCVDLEEFYKFLQNRVLITFKPRHDAMATTIQFSLVLSETFTYDQMAQLVSAKLHHEPEKLRFTSSHEGNPQTVILRTSPRSNSWRCSPETITVDKMIRPPGADTSSYSKSKPNNVLFYELLDLPTGEVHRKRMVTVTWTGAQNREEGKYSMLMPTTCSMHEVANKLSTMVQFSKNSSRKIRLFTIQDGKVQTPFTGEELLWTVLDVENIYAAEASTMTMKQYDPSAMLKMLQFVVKLKVDGSNYQQWLKALESVLGMATGKAGILTLPGHTLSPSEDLMIKQAIMASVDDALVLTVLEAESGMQLPIPLFLSTPPSTNFPTMSKRLTIRLSYDIVSPWSYFAYVVLKRYRPIWDFDLILNPVYLGGVMKGSKNTPPFAAPNKREHY
ncbi:hypothetical protein PtA15_4A167 [Puccinia triticina]|uniref:ubiquitinyl hydrolase 1 n=1 Tax=Puccinia triticina TaxID=208348 RepID=A0ABY7CF69_9BASI|nr:uncharacterized protein PtA15_4A167 [Puccinia triticina]WAQ83719.1 hypothetical protein PtA15_4A167 [Puccinia triticina]